MVDSKADYEICLLYASKRFSKREATVMGPAPPGTGEIALTIFETSTKLTSPTSLGELNKDCPCSTCLIAFIPTSITTWFLETCSLPIKFGLPAATTKISADLVICAKFLVCWWQTVTVAFRFKNA